MLTEPIRLDKNSKVWTLRIASDELRGVEEYSTSFTQSLEGIEESGEGIKVEWEFKPVSLRMCVP